jgi:magnesium transporter
MFDIKINDFHKIDLNNPLHPSIFIKTEDYDIFIFRMPFSEDNSIVSKNNSYICTKDSYFLYKQNEFIDLHNFKGMYKSLNEVISHSLQMTLDIYRSIDDMEDSFYENQYVKDFNKIWFMKKNNLIKINRVLNKSIEEFKNFIKNYKNETDYLEIHFDDLLEHLERTNRYAIHGLDKLDTLYNFFTSTNNEKMNKTIYILTILSGVFLPLNLIVGFFGMNTTSLPFTKNEYGTISVIFILIGVLFISYALTILLKKYRQ